MTQNKRPQGNATLPRAERSLSETGWDFLALRHDAF